MELFETIAFWFLAGAAVVGLLFLIFFLAAAMVYNGTRGR